MAFDDIVLKHLFSEKPTFKILKNLAESLVTENRILELKIMTDEPSNDQHFSKTFALRSLQLAAERTDFTLIRTGFAAAAFGAG